MSTFKIKHFSGKNFNSVQFPEIYLKLYNILGCRKSLWIYFNEWKCSPPPYLSDIQQSLATMQTSKTIFLVLYLFSELCFSTWLNFNTSSLFLPSFHIKYKAL